MKKASFLPILLIAATTLFMLTACQPQETDSQEPEDVSNRKSPIAISAINHANTYIKVVYGQPYKRGRVIFGELEPYGEVWRTGANEATEITLTDSVSMGGEVIEPGTYALFTIPEPDSFTVILNTDLGQWGAFEYNENQDYKRMKFPVRKLESPVEAFAIEFSDPVDNTSVMSLKWDVVQVNVPIRFQGK